MIDYVAPIVSGIAVVIAAYLAYKGTKDSNSGSELFNVAKLYGEYADRMNARVTAVEEKHAKLEADQNDITERLSHAEKEAEKYKKEASEYKKLIVEVVQWITELLDWEIRGYQGPAPKVTLNMVLSHLTKFMNSKDFDSPSYKERERHDGY